jgi:3-hydroxyisobutyrate dehydrogenase-like beta-hydroxyacid dehydrogenase
MDMHSGQIYESMQHATDAGIPAKNLIEVVGTREQVAQLSQMIQRMKRKDKNERQLKIKQKRKAANTARKRNR